MTVAEIKKYVQKSYEMKKRISNIKCQIEDYERNAAVIKSSKITGMPHAAAIDSQLTVYVERLEELNYKLTVAQAEYRLLQFKVKNMLSMLPDTSDGRQILDMRSRGWEFEAIAPILNISMSTLWVRYRDAVKKIAEN